MKNPNILYASISSSNKKNLFSTNKRKCLKHKIKSFNATCNSNEVDNTNGSLVRIAFRWATLLAPDDETKNWVPLISHNWLLCSILCVCVVLWLDPSFVVCHFEQSVARIVLFALCVCVRVRFVRLCFVLIHYSVFSCSHSHSHTHTHCNSLISKKQSQHLFFFSLSLFALTLCSNRMQ